MQTISGSKRQHIPHISEGVSFVGIILHESLTRTVTVSCHLLGCSTLINAWLGRLIRVFVFHIFHNTKLWPESVGLFWFGILGVVCCFHWFFICFLGFFKIYFPFSFCSKFANIHRLTLLGVEDWTGLREKRCHVSALISLETMLMWIQNVSIFYGKHVLYEHILIFLLFLSSQFKAKRLTERQTSCSEC